MLEPHKITTRTGRLHPRLAVALRYEQGKSQEPMVVASGRGAFAERMEQIAEEHHIPIHQDKALAALLGDLEVPSEIPDELFEAVARVIAFVWRVDSRVGQSPA